MLVLPPFQRMGLGAEMLNTIYSSYQSDARVLDITGEPLGVSLCVIVFPVDEKMGKRCNECKS